MQVKLISLTKSMIEGMDLSPEELIVYTARVSNPANQNNLETSEKLLKYLIKNKHWSPLDMVDMTVEVKTSRAIAQQILRHWSHRFQEFSQRYAEVVEMEPIQIRKAGATNRQSSTEAFDPLIYSDVYGDYKNSSTAINAYVDEGQRLYRELIREGVAKECARMVLPLTTQTTIYMKASARSWFHYFEQRCDSHAQLEHQQVANAILEIYKQYFPNLANALVYDKGSN